MQSKEDKISRRYLWRKQKAGVDDTVCKLIKECYQFEQPKKVNLVKSEEITTIREIISSDDDLLKFAVIISKSNSKWVFCKHRDRDTYEVPGGHREAGEFEEELHSEMEKVVLLDELPDEWTYPLIQPLLIAEYERRK